MKVNDIAHAIFEYTVSESEAYLSGIPLDVLLHFERLTLEVIKTGRTRYSADAILHRIRWHFNIERGDDSFKCNNNWTSTLARWFMERHPEHKGFFEIRTRQLDELQDNQLVAA